MPGAQGIRRNIFQVGVKGQQRVQAQIKCVACGLWVARMSTDAEQSLFACNTRCIRMWQLNQMETFRHQASTHARVCGCRDEGCKDGEVSSSGTARPTHGNGTLPSFRPH
jgi:hypothetical protein